MDGCVLEVVYDGEAIDASDPEELLVFCGSDDRYGDVWEQTDAMGGLEAWAALDAVGTDV